MLHRLHHLVELLHRAALRHSGVDAQGRTAGFTVEIGPVHRFVEKGETSAQNLVDHLAVGTVGLPFEVFGYQAGRYAERKHEDEDEEPAVPQAEVDVRGVTPVPARDASQAALPPGTGTAEIHREIIQQGGHEEICDQQRNAEVDDYGKGEFRQAELFLLRQEENHHQGGNRGQHGAQQGREHAAVVVAGIVVHHHDGVVDDDSERYRDPGEGVDVDFQAHQPVQAHGDEYVHRKGDGHHEHISPRAVDKEGEDQEYEQAEQGAHINLVELAAYVFRRVVIDHYAYLLGKVRPEFLNLLLDLPDHGDEVGIPAHPHCKIEGIEAVDAEVTRRKGFLVAELGYLAEPHDSSVHVLDRNFRHIRQVFAPEFHRKALIPGRNQSKQALVISLSEGQGNLVRTYSQAPGEFIVKAYDPFIRGVAVEIDILDSLDGGEGIYQGLLHKVRNVLGRKAAEYVEGNGSGTLSAGGTQGDGGIGAGLGQGGVYVSYV